MKNELIKENKTELLIYESTNGNIKLDVNLEGETVWLSLEQMTRLFGRDKSVISRHIKNIFEEGELERNASTIANFATVQQEGTRKVERSIDYYNLDVVLCLGSPCTYVPWYCVPFSSLHTHPGHHHFPLGHLSVLPTPQQLTGTLYLQTSKLSSHLDSIVLWSRIA